MIIEFFRLLKYWNRKHYCGHIRWLLTDKKGKHTSCSRCGNIANGVLVIKKYDMTFNIPQCKKHLFEIYQKARPQTDGLNFPCVLSGQEFNQP